MEPELYKEFVEVVHLTWPDWEIVEKLGSGAFASVFRASRKEKIAGEKDSAIKIIRIPHDDSDWDQMISEGKSATQVRAYFQEAVNEAQKEILAMEELGGLTNIVNILDYKVHEEPERNAWYILIRMEYLQKINPDTMDEREIRKLGSDVCTALSVCRKKNIVHRDISMDNVFLYEGNYKLGDFGVAKVLEEAVVGMRSIVGKPLYMAPEVYNSTLSDTSDIDTIAKVDIYSLGILLYRLSNRMRYPFEDPEKEVVKASERQEAFRRRMIDGETLPSPVDASPELAKIILKACEFNPEKRYANADEMKQDILALDMGNGSSIPENLWKKILLILVTIAVLFSAYYFFLRPILFPSWSEWSAWTDTPLKDYDPDLMQEEIKKQNKWWAIKCSDCGANNPPEMGEDFKCVGCGKELNRDQYSGKEVYYYSDDIPSLTIIYNKKLGHVFNGQPYWYVSEITRYRYRNKDQKEVPVVSKIYHVTVRCPKGMTDSEFKLAQETLRARLDILAGGKSYQWNELEDRIKIDIPEELFGDLPADEVLADYLMCAGRLYAMDYKFSYGENVSVERKDVQNVISMYGSIEGIQAEEHGINTPEYHYLKVVVSDEFAKENRQKFSLWNSFAIAIDYVESPTHFSIWYTIPADEWKVYYILDDSFESIPNLIDLVLYNYTHDPLQVSLDYEVDLNSLASWINPSLSARTFSVRKGKKQCSPDAVDIPSVTFSIGHDDFTEGQIIDTENALLERLDAIGIPYSFGTMKKDGEEYYIVKIGTSRMSTAMMNILTESSPLLYIGTSASYATVRVEGLNVVYNDQKENIEISLLKDYSLYDRTIEELRILAEQAMEIDGYLHICEGYTQPLFVANAETFLRDEILEIKSLCEVQDFRYFVKPIGSNAEWITAFLQAISRTSYMSRLRLDQYEMNELKDASIPSEDQFFLSYNMNTDDLVKDINSIIPNANVRYNNFIIQIYLHLPVDDQLPVKGTELVKEIYEKIDFPSLIYEKINFILVDEIDSEKARITFAKNVLNVVPGPAIKSYQVEGIFENGRIEEYKDAILEQIKGMSFYQEFSQNANSWRTEDQ